MSDEEKKHSLVLSTIARHASGYWYNQTRESDKPTSELLINMVQLSTFGASTVFLKVDNEEVGVAVAILNAYIATGKAIKK